MTATTVDSSRRHFLIRATTTLTVVAAASTAVPFLASWQPTSQTRVAGRPAKVNVTKIADGEGVKILWRGTPIWIVRRSAAVIAQLASLSGELKDPDTAASEQPVYVSNLTRSRRADIMVLTAICTHLGCIPELRSADDAALGAGMLSGFVCPCHGSRFDAAGRVLKGSPASINLAIPPHYFMNDAVLVVGVEGPEQPAQVFREVSDTAMTSVSRCSSLLSLIGVLGVSVALGAETAGSVDPERISQTVKVLASDEFEGRAPGTPGETKTIEWLTKSFRELGLEPGGERGSWTQAVPLVRTQIGSPAALSIAIQGKDRPLTQSNDVYVSTVRKVDRVSIKEAPVVFVGYGVTAPERQWDDYKKVDLRGKVAVYLVNDPDFYARAGEPVAGRFGNRRMTYYGRWTYKFEEAARRGAIAALIVHDTEGAGYGWSTVIAPAGENYDVVREDPNERVLLQGWLASAAADEIFKSAGLDLAALSVQARRADFAPVELKNVHFNANLPVTATLAESRNFLAKIPGSKRPDETIMFAAHWDAYGIGPPDAQGRKIRPGANDDALGVAGVLELARVFKAGPRPERTLVFAAWTAEERGLLGSQTYAAKPLYPVEKTVANLTLDILQTAGLAKDVLLVGAGQSELEDDLARAAAAQGRVVTPESLPERGLFYRADHFPLARTGVPVLLLMAISGAADMREGGREAGNRWLESYMRCYHQACDAWDASLDFRGAAQDVELFHTIGKSLANSTRWPRWRADSEFHAVRAKSDAQRR